MMAPRFFAAASVAVLTLALAACAGGPASGSGAGTTARAGAPSVQFVNPLPKYPSWRRVGDCMKKRAEATGIDFVETGPTGSLDPTKMIQQVQQGIASKKSAIVTFPASQAFGPVLQQAQKAGIATATLYGSEDPASGADINVGVDWTALGEQYVQAIAQRPGEQNVGLIAAADTGVGKSWLDGMKAAAAKTSNVKIVGEVYTGDDAAKALPQASALLTAHPEVSVITTHMGTTTPGVIAAIQEKGATGKIAFLAIGPDNGGKEGLVNGTVWRVVVQDLCGLATSALDGVVKQIGKPIPGPAVPFIPAATAMATADDLQGYLNKGWG